MEPANTAWTRERVAKTLDHSLLKPTFREADLRAGCELAVRLGVASVCIVPHAVPLCVKLLEGSGVHPSTTIGFPHGMHLPEVKLSESMRALDQGATELDMVINVSRALDERWGMVRDEIGSILRVTHNASARLKVIFECCYLDRASIVELCRLCSELGVDWVKTSTGFGSHGATPEHVQLLREHAAPGVQVKASGGIRDAASALQFLELGATRIGTSASEGILAALPS